MTDPRATPLAKGDLQGKLLNLIYAAYSQSLLRVGVNETTKQVNRQHAALVVLAADAQPLELALALPLVCEDKGVPYVFVAAQEYIGRAAGGSRPAMAVAILKGTQGVEQLIEQVEIL